MRGRDRGVRVPEGSERAAEPTEFCACTIEPEFCCVQMVLGFAGLHANPWGKEKIT